MGLLDIQMLLLLGYTCHSFHEMSLREVKKFYHIFLQQLVHNPESLRRVLRKTNAVISSTAALAFVTQPFMSSNNSVTTARIYTPYRIFDDLCGYLIDIEGGSYEETTLLGRKTAWVQFQYLSFGILNLVHIWTSKAVFEIGQSASASPTWPIPYHWNTLLFTFVTADTFCVTYPIWLLLGRNLFQVIFLHWLKNLRENVTSSESADIWLLGVYLSSLQNILAH